MRSSTGFQYAPEVTRPADTSRAEWALWKVVGLFALAAIVISGEIESRRKK